MRSSAAPQSAPEGPGSVSGAPNLPAGFTDTFTSRYIDTGALRLHAVIGGEGPPLLLVHGWPETWYADRGLRVRAMVRCEDERAAALRAAGAEVVVGDLLKPADIYRVVSGCRRAYFGMSVSAGYLEATVSMAAKGR